MKIAGGDNVDTDSDLNLMRQEFDLGPLRDMTWLQMEGGFLYGAHEVILPHFHSVLNSPKIIENLCLREFRWVKWKDRRGALLVGEPSLCLI